MTAAIKFSLEPGDNRRLATLCGVQNSNLTTIAEELKLEIKNRGFDFELIGTKAATSKAKQLLEQLYAETETKENLNLTEIMAPTVETTQITIKTPKLIIKPRTPNQTQYLNNIRENVISFAIGPAGTGKTYLATAYAVEMLEQEKVSRIIIARPVVEAGESLGYLPGDIAQKVDPYLRPIYDALYQMLGTNDTNKLIQSSIIEIAPLAFMRGRTLNDAAIILDEAQNTTIAQMKMFLTRIGFNSKAIITGDITQSDLPKQQQPGLKQAAAILGDITGISFTFLQAQDAVRHPLVQKIIRAYTRTDK